MPGLHRTAGEEQVPSPSRLPELSGAPAAAADPSLAALRDLHELGRAGGAPAERGVTVTPAVEEDARLLPGQ